MEKRVLIAVFLSFLVIYVYQSLVPPPEPTQPASPTVPAERAPAGAPAEPPATIGQPVAPESPGVAAPSAPIVADTMAREIVVETDTVRAVFSTRGAVLTRWVLKRYLVDGEPLEMVPPQLPPDSGLPFELAMDDPGIAAILNQALFRGTRSASPPGVSFEYEDESGLRARKTFTLDPRAHPYVLSFSLSVESGGRALNPSIALGPALGAGRGDGGYYTSTPPRAIFGREGDVSRVKAGDIGAGRVEEGSFTFVGADDHYFLSAVLLPRQALRVEYRPLTVPGAVGEEPRTFVQYAARFAGPPEQERLFLGPKDFDALAAVDSNLTRAIDFGIFAWLVVPLLRALKWINGSVGNYGWSIILLTILINVAMFPLRHKSVVSMRKLQAIQPQVKAIQDRYSKLKMTDPGRQKMNVELMNLYRERGVNPASGCVPMLLTFPVLFAFYAMLSVSVEIRGEPWIGWIHDLSAHDPMYITPVLMGATMVWQQRLTPMNMDPMQQKILMLTPIMFTVFFLWAPSGLVLYWLVSNVWTISQQLITNRIIGPPPVHTLRPAAERKVKKAGSVKSDQAR
jgi:YidC/Oxa1 family membrane protein insertase